MISAKIVADSYSTVNGKRITTFEVEFPRWILAEWNTHRVFSRNAASTRAVPIMKQLEMIAAQPAMPSFYGKNQAGMVAKEELDFESKDKCEKVILEMLEFISDKVTELNELGLHKQHSGRYLEPWMHVKGVVTSTEWDNFFWLRKHEDAQPEIKELAERMYEQLEWNKCLTIELDAGDWHTPYYEAGYWLQDDETPLEDALAISSSCCAQVSYRLLDDSIEKARKVYQRLVESTPVHASPFEHCASPMKYPKYFGEQAICGVSEEGVTHVSVGGEAWSGNFKSWIQYRQLIDGNVCNKYEGK